MIKESEVNEYPPVITGNLKIRGDEYIVIPDWRKLRKELRVSERGSAQDGDKVIVELEQAGTTDDADNPTARVVESLGRAGYRDIEDLAIYRTMCIQPDFPSEVLQEAENLSDTIPETEIAERLDLRELPTYTINPDDPDSSPPVISNFGFALSLSKKGDRHILYSHFSDVSYFVKPESKIFAEAMKRGGTIFYPDRSIPMLPSRISEDLGKFRENRDRLAFTVISEIDSKGRIYTQSFHKSIIRVDYNLSYVDVFSLNEGLNAMREIVHQWDLEEILNRWFSIFYHYMNRKYNGNRERRGIISLLKDEWCVEFDETGRLIRLDDYVFYEDTANRFTGNASSIANEYISRTLDIHNIPALYINQPSPDVAEMERILHLIESCGFEVEKKSSTAQTFQRVVSFQLYGYSVAFDYLARKIIPPERYSLQGEEHFRLALRNYTRCTSPLDRICDLTIQYILNDCYFSRKEKPELPDSSLDRVIVQASRAERINHVLRRETEDRYRRWYMRSQTGKIYKGLIVNFRKDFIVVSLRLEELPVTGYIPINDLKDDEYILDSETMTLKGRRSTNLFRLGQNIRVKVKEANTSIVFSYLGSIE